MKTFEVLARERKAAVLVATLHKYGITSTEATLASNEDWKLAAQVAKTKPPSESTQRLCIEMLRNLEQTHGQRSDGSEANRIA